MSKIREISDEEAFKNFEKSAVELDLDENRLAKFGPKGFETKSLREILKAMEREVKGKKEKKKTVDVLGREELEKQKDWIRYKIEKGWMK